MSMDALTKLALDTLLDKILPELKHGLLEIQKQYPRSNPDSELKYTIHESYQLLTILGKWAGVEPDSLNHQNVSSQNATSGEMSDEEAMMLMNVMDEAPAPINPTSADQMSDEEAMMLLSDMDGSSEKNPASKVNSDDISDEDAMALLAAMDENTNVVEDASEEVIAETNVVEVTESREEVCEIEEFGNSEFGQDPEMIKDFMTNSRELMEVLDEQILELERDPTNKETIEEIFRAAHTLKGAAGMFGYLAIERVMHRMENYFDQIRKEKIIATPDSIDVILKAVDVLKTLMEAVEAGKPCGFKTAPIVTDLTLLSEGKFTKKHAASQKEKSDSANDKVSTDSNAVKQAPAEKAKKKEDSTIRVDIKRLDTLVNLVGELVTDRTRFMNIEEELHKYAPQLNTTANMSETVQLFGRHMNEIQENIMKVRMVPIGNAFNKFSRIIRDLSRQLGKEIELVIEGESTELDKTLVEQIADPLVHLIRNSCDHGVEMPDTRVASGKPAQGKIFLSAKQEGNHIIITIQDDGKGIPADIIRKKGIEKGLIKEEDILSEKEIFSLIFEAGFSTAEQVTNISGRGVGMDVVKKQIQKLKGVIDIDSKLGRGTTISIQLPLTLAILQSLLVRSEFETFAIPLNAVVESIRISPDEIQKVGGTEVIRRRDQVLPLFNLSEVLELHKKHDNFWYQKPISVMENARAEKQKAKKKERLFVVVVGTGERRFGIIVDTLLFQQEMVIKPLGNFMKEIPCVAGGAILGNGEVVLVLDIADIDTIFRNKTRPKIAA